MKYLLLLLTLTSLATATEIRLKPCGSDLKHEMFTNYSTENKIQLIQYISGVRCFSRMTNRQCQQISGAQIINRGEMDERVQNHNHSMSHVVESVLKIKEMRAGEFLTIGEKTYFCEED